MSCVAISQLSHIGQQPHGTLVFLTRLTRHTNTRPMRGITRRLGTLYHLTPQHSNVCIVYPTIH